MASSEVKMSEKVVDETLVLARTNALLARLDFGDRAFSRAADLVASVSSMSVALYEKLFQFRLPDVVRVPRTLQDYERNAQLVVDALSGAMLDSEALEASRISSAPAKLSGKSLCGGDCQAILRLVEMLEGVYDILYDDDGVFRGGKLPVPERHSTRQHKMFQATSQLKEAKTTKTTGRAAKAPSGRTERKIEKSRRGYEGDESSDMDSDSGSDPLQRRSHQTTERRRAKASRLNASRARNDPKQAEIRSGGVVRQHAASGRSRPTFSAPSSSSSAASSSPTDHRLARSLVTANPRQSVEKLSKSTSSVKSLKKKMSASQHRDHVQAMAMHEDGASTQVYSATHSVRMVPKTNDTLNDLLQTKKYGRFVGSNAATSPSTRIQGASNKMDKRGAKNLSFGDVSSVSIASEISRHFLDEGTDLANTFSALSVTSPRSEHSSRISHSDNEDPVKPEKKAIEHPGASRSRSMNPNQQEAAAETEDLHEPPGYDDMEIENINENTEGQSPASPSAKTAKRGGDDESQAVDPSISLHGPKSNSVKNPLYPLLPGAKRRTGTSKSEAEYLRYKLTLKNHLQDLRQREYCQRKHMERAYRAGEHTANVDKIRARRFAQDIRLQRIAIGLETKEEEEKQLRRAMHHLLDLEKEKLREEHRVTTTMLKQIQKDHQEREEALETFYANQIRLVREKTTREAKERELMEKAHRQASEQMMREMRRERESQLVALLQEKQQLEEARRFRQATHMAQLLERTDQQAIEHTDAFYTAATKARQRREQSRSSPTITRRRKETELAYAKSKLKAKASASKARSTTLRHSTRVY